MCAIFTEYKLSVLQQIWLFSVRMQKVYLHDKWYLEGLRRDTKRPNAGLLLVRREVIIWPNSSLLIKCKLTYII